MTNVHLAVTALRWRFGQQITMSRELWRRIHDAGYAIEWDVVRSDEWDCMTAVVLGVSHRGVALGALPESSPPPSP